MSMGMASEPASAGVSVVLGIIGLVAILVAILLGMSG